MPVEFLTASSTRKPQEAVTSLNNNTPTPSTYQFGSTQSESQSAPANTSNPGLVLGVLVGLIVFFALLCTWCCKRRFSKKTSAKTQVAAGYSLPQYPSGSYAYPQPHAPPPAVVHEQGPWPGYPWHYYSPTDTWARPRAPNEGTFGPRQMSEYGGYVPQQSAPAPQRNGNKRLSIGSRFPIAPRSG